MQNSELTPPADFAPTENAEADIQLLVERGIHLRTNRMIQDLKVCICPQGREVTVTGRTKTYYTKQLATHGVLDLDSALRVNNLIEVN